MPFDPTKLTKIELQRLREARRCPNYYYKAKSWGYLNNAAWDRLLDRAEGQIERDEIDLEELRKFFDDLKITEDHYKDVQCQEDFVFKIILLVCGCDFEELLDYFDSDDASLTIVDSQRGPSIHMAQQINKHNEVISELFQIGGQELSPSSEEYDEENVLYNHQNGSIIFADHMNILVVYVVMHFVISYEIKHDGYFTKGGKANSRRVLFRGTEIDTYHHKVYVHDLREVVPVCSINDALNGGIEVRVLCLLCSNLYYECLIK